MLGGVVQQRARLSPSKQGSCVAVESADDLQRRPRWASTAAPKERPGRGGGFLRKRRPATVLKSGAGGLGCLNVVC
jgi:hypothetical protein